MSLVYLNFDPPPLPNGRYRPTLGHPLQSRAPAPCFPQSTNLRCISRKRTLCVLDGDNLDYSLKRQGLILRYAVLLQRLNSLAKPVFAHVVITSPPGDNRRASQIQADGWRVLSVPWENVTTFRGVEKRANADFEIAFEIGRLASIYQCNAALIGTGDGDLATSCALSLRRHADLQIHALSVAGASSARLRNRTDLFDSNLIIGADLSRRISWQPKS